MTTPQWQIWLCNGPEPTHWGQDERWVGGVQWADSIMEKGGAVRHSSLRIDIILCMLHPGMESGAESPLCSRGGQGTGGNYIIEACRLCIVIGVQTFVNAVQECALSLQSGLPLSGEQSSEETAGGRAVLAAAAVAHNYSPLSTSLSSLSTQRNRESNTNNTAHLKPQLNHVCQDIIVPHEQIPFLVGTSYPLMISLHSARMKCSLSEVRMHSEFFWPVLASPLMTSLHWFILIVPWGRVLGWGTQHRHVEKVLKRGK